MKRISARYFLGMSVADMWNVLTGEFILVFDDGEIQTNAFETLYSAYSWNFHREFPATPLLKRHHLQEVLRLEDKTRLGSETHLTLLGNVMWSVYDHYVGNRLPLIINKEMRVPDTMGHTLTYVQPTQVPEIQFQDYLAEKIYRTTNLMYNDLSYRLEEHVVSLDITDFMEVLAHPEIRAANEELQSLSTQELAVLKIPVGQQMIDKAMKTIRTVLRSPTTLPNNPLSLAVQSQLVNIAQVVQCVGPLGYRTDTDSNLFHQPVMRGYAQGLRYFYDSLVESRSAAKALIFSKTPLQQAEYFSRRLQLMSQIVQNLHPGDCGTTQYLNWEVRQGRQEGSEYKKGDFEKLIGKHYMDDDGILKTIHHGDQTKLTGRELKIRSVLHCAHPDPYGVCATCFGELSLSVPEGTNLGQMCCTSLAQKSSQNVLSVKHLDGSSQVEGVKLEPDHRRYLKVAPDENSYLLSEEVKGRKLVMIVVAEHAQNLTDVMQVKDVHTLSIARISELGEVGFLLVDDPTEIITSIEVSLNRRLASMTYSLLAHVQKYGWTVDDRGNYRIDLTHYDWSKPILTLPLKHFNMSDHSRDIASMLESSVDKLQERDGTVSPNIALRALFDLVNDKLVVNLAVLDVVLYATMIVSAEEHNYSLPKPWTTSGLGVMKLSMVNRSLSAAMAYQGHREVIISPSSYISTNRPDHPMDGILCPAEKFEGKQSV